MIEKESRLRSRKVLDYDREKFSTTIEESSRLRSRKNLDYDREKFSTTIETKFSTMIETKFSTMIETKFSTTIETKFSTTIETKFSTTIETKFSTTIEKKFSTTIEKSSHDRDSRSISITIDKNLDYDRQVSRLRSRRFSTLIEKIPKKKKKKIPLALDLRYRDASRLRWFFNLVLMHLFICIKLTCCPYYMPLSLPSSGIGREGSLNTDPYGAETPGSSPAFAPLCSFRFHL